MEQMMERAYQRDADCDPEKLRGPQLADRLLMQSRYQR